MERISEGRVGLVYSAEAEVIRDTADSNLPDLCVKLVKPKYGRSLAQETWFYEQLARNPGYEGVATPRCFGFFTVPLNDCRDLKGQPVTHIKPWEDYLAEQDFDDAGGLFQEVEDTDWWLPDDPPGSEHCFTDDDGWKSGSP